MMHESYLCPNSETIYGHLMYYFKELTEFSKLTHL